MRLPNFTGAIRWLLPLVVLASTLALAWHTLARRPIDRTRVYRIGYGNDVPFHFKDAQGNPSGLAVKIVEEAARRQGIQLQWQEGKPQADLWVLMTARAKKLEDLYLTEPYLQSEACWVVLETSAFTEESQLTHARVSYLNFRVHRESLQLAMPECIRVPTATAREALEKVVNGEADAAYLDRYALLPAVLHSTPGKGVRILASSVPPHPMGLASSLATAAVADAIRDGMRSMADDGTMSRIVQQWGFFPNLTADLIRELVTAERRHRWIMVAVTGAGLLVLSSGYLVVRSKAQSLRLGTTQSLLKHERQLNEAILNSVPGMLYLFDREDRLIRWNPQYEQITGYGGEEIRRGHGIEKIGGHGTNLSLLQTAFAEARLHGKSSVEADLVTKSGARIPFFFTAVSVEISGQPCVTGIGIDITERRRVEAERSRIESQFFQAQKMDSVGQLAGGVAHDFNNILAVIMMHIDLVELQPDLGEETRHSLGEMSKAAQRAAHLTRQLLMFSRKSAVEITQIDLTKLIQELLKMVEALLGDNIQVRFECRADVTRVDGDEGMLEQVLLNLVLNARDAMAEGGTLEISLDQVNVATERFVGDIRVPPGTYVCISVSDTGCGMDETVQRRLFEPFFTTKQPGKGTGLGLASAYGIVVQHNGWIEVHSRIDEGSAFRVHLPVTKNLPVQVQSNGKTTMRSGNETLLYVESDANLRWVVTRNLERLGYHVIEAESSQEAFEKWRTHERSIDLLFSNMAVNARVTGLDLAEQFRAAKPELKVILCIRHPSEIQNLSYRKVAPIEYLSKPYSIDQLSKAIRSCIERA